MAISIVATTQDVYPPRVLVSVTGLTLGDHVEIYRVVSSDQTLIRGGLIASATDTSVVVVDAELPMNIPVHYLVIINNTDLLNSSDVSNTVSDEAFDLITDAISGDSAQAIRVSQPEWEYDNNVSIYQAGGRNVVVSSGAITQFSLSEIEFYTTATSSSDNLKNLLQNTTSGIVQIRDSMGGSFYATVSSFREQRYSNDRTDGRRFFILQVVEVSAWAPSLEARGFTLQDIADYYGVTGTLQSIANDYSTLLAIAQGDFS